MNRYLVIVARDRPNLFEQLSERQLPEIKVLLDRRITARSPGRTSQPISGAWHTTLERDWYIVVQATGIGGRDREAVPPA